jgi:hypothetical protein
MLGAACLSNVGTAFATKTGAPDRGAQRRLEVPGPIAEVLARFKALAPPARRGPGPYPRNADANLPSVLKYLGPSGLDFSNFTNEGVDEAHPDVVRRHVSLAALGRQLESRNGTEYEWLMELLGDLRWRKVDAFVPSLRRDGKTTVVNLSDEYLVTFVDVDGAPRMSRVEYLLDPDGGD